VKKERDKQWADYYDQVDILDELLEEPAEFSLGERLWTRCSFKKEEKETSEYNDQNRSPSGPGHWEIGNDEIGPLSNIDSALALRRN